MNYATFYLRKFFLLIDISILNFADVGKMQKKENRKQKSKIQKSKTETVRLWNRFMQNIGAYEISPVKP
jgi:hypothetical protein